ncbi:hypothetical protein EVAR_87217_1 [Eumeta japonica]|uniref:Uncharacterized protein n=1 Tax=Eumeta variegata TaxID=151549 RepID=A0A4C1VU26_EUMVA|nr:hypothetical protein EVAR_87217_1 [Eumeta japonica]
MVELSKLKVQNQEIEIGNEFSTILPAAITNFRNTCKVESCHSAKSIKYCKYVTKGSDMAVFAIASENANDEISNFKWADTSVLMKHCGDYCHFKFMKISQFVHLAVHLENGQRVYFTEANAAQRAERPPSTTLTSFFAMCEADPFAATLMYVGQVLHLEAINKEIPTSQTRNPSSRLATGVSTDAR